MRLIEMVPRWKQKRQEPMVTLRILEAGAAARRCTIRQFPAAIGRNLDNDLSIADGWVSRMHCLLQVAHGQVVIRDLESVNGTFVNHQRVSEKALALGDDIRIGAAEILVLSLRTGQ